MRLKTNKKKTTKIWLKRSSLLEAFYKNGVPRNFTKFTGKHMCQNLFFNKVAGSSMQLIKKEALTQVFRRVTIGGREDVSTALFQN